MSAAAPYQSLEPNPHQCHFPENLVGLFCFAILGLNITLCTLLQEPLKGVITAAIGFFFFVYSSAVQIALCHHYPPFTITNTCDKFYHFINSTYKDLLLNAPLNLLAAALLFLAAKEKDTTLTNVAVIFTMLSVNISLTIVNYNCSTGRSALDYIRNTQPS